jgi:hypothetical protein
MRYVRDPGNHRKQNKGATHCYAVVDSVDFPVAGQADGQICENRACEIRSCGGDSHGSYAS